MRQSVVTITKCDTLIFLQLPNQLLEFQDSITRLDY